MADKKRMIDANTKIIDKYFNKRLIRVDVILKGIETFKRCYEENEKELTPVIVKTAFTALSMVEQFVKETPTVDAVEVVHGRWMKQGKHDWVCSSCKIGVPYPYTGFHYCPNCGAKMDGGKDDGIRKES